MKVASPSLDDAGLLLDVVGAVLVASPVVLSLFGGCEEKRES